MLTPIPELIAQAKQSIRCLDAESAVPEYKSNGGLLIDVREPAEYQKDGVSDAVNIPRGLLEMKIMEMEKDPTRPIYLHCATSARAALSAEQLKRVGYENVTVITCNVKDIHQAHS